MNNKQRIFLSVLIGVIVIAGSFLAVFGSSLKNLKQEVSQDTTPVVTTPAVKPQPTKPVGIKDDDDEEYDEDDYGTNSPVPAPTPTPTPTPKPTPAPTPSGYTLAQVSTHNSATSCWSAINGNVYDLTSWVNAHPGGKAAILMICGKDGSPLFNAQHGGSGKVANILVKYKIGALN